MLFKKILIANRGEIAVRILRTCHQMGIAVISLYEAPDQGSLHVRMADECIQLKTALGFSDQDEILRIAKERGADAIHPGYGFLAEEADFIRACTQAGITFIGPPADVVETVRNKIGTMERVESAGFPVVKHSRLTFNAYTKGELQSAADELGYPLVIKSCHGGRGRGERFIRSAARLEETMRSAQAEAQAVYGDRTVYLEKAILHPHQLGVQVIGDAYGHLIELGAREGSLIYGNQKIVSETPPPSLSEEQCAKLRQRAYELANLLNYQNVGTIEFLQDETGEFNFTEVKARIQIDHPLTEIVTRIDLIREQIRITAGEALGTEQQDLQISGWAMQCRVSAEDPWNNFLPSPGPLRKVRLPGGIDVRVDTYVYPGCNVPAEYDSLIAKVIVWGRDREACISRMQQSLEEFKLNGSPSNLPLLQRVFKDTDFCKGCYNGESIIDQIVETTDPDAYMRDLAVAIAIIYARRSQAFRPSVPDRLINGWHRDSRRLS